MSGSLPSILLPHLEALRSRIPARNVPLDFWQIDSGPKILNGFMDLASVLMQSDIDEREVPKGYVMLAYVFDWEASCQSDGWGAFRNIGPDQFERVCEYFEQLELPAEARSLRHQMEIYRRSPDDHEALVQASDRFAHPLSGDLDRLEYLTQYFCDHADALLYSDA